MTGTATRHQRRLRRNLLLWSLPLVLVAGFAGVKLIGQHVIAEQAVSQHFAGEHEGSLNSSGQLTILNLVERWKPHYNMGTSYLELDALTESRAEFETALGLASPPEQCPIRANYAIAVEREGDNFLLEGDRDAAISRWEAALGLLSDADPSCEFSTSNRSINDSTIRIEEKQQEQQEQQEQEENQDGGDGEGDSDQQPESQPEDDALEDLEEGLDENQQERENDLDDQEGGGGYGGPSVDEPW